MDTVEQTTYDNQLSQRFQSLIWSCLDCDLTRTAVFYAERFFAVAGNNHVARHMYSLSLLREGQTYSALALVNIPRPQQCSGCLELKAKCCTVLGRFRQAGEALEESLKDASYGSTSSSAHRTARQFPEEAAIHCRTGSMALKGNLQDKAAASFQQALNLNPLLWEAFEGLCTLGVVPEINTLFPYRPPPTRRVPPEDTLPKSSFPVATGAAFFTPDGGHTGNLFRPWDATAAVQPTRMGPPAQPELLTSTYPTPLESQLHRNAKPQPSMNVPPQPHFSRPLSSAEETGPVPKKMRSTRQLETSKTSKFLKQNGDDPQKKARDRPGFQLSNFFSSSARRSQQPSRSGNPSKTGNANTSMMTRRSNRLLSGTGPKQGTKVPRDRRRQAPHLRSKSFDSDTEDDAYAAEAAYSPSPPNAQSPRSDRSLSPGPWGSPAAVQEAYEIELAEHYIYDIMRRYATATRALTVYDSDLCISEIQQLSEDDQSTPWSLSLRGRAEYEKADYIHAEKTFKALRIAEPYRLWDMEVYSTLLWYLQRNVELSFLAQELLNINPRSPQAWIAIGNLFSLQKERTQALTCFGRAAQMDPSCAYAYTLSGHESIDEDLTKAINFFQSALRVDPRHYNAWYGLGSCYLRMSKLRLAEYHYRKATTIHPNNAVLLGCVGMVLERKGDRSAAIAIFDEAIGIAPENALVRYRRAKILISMRKYETAIKDLEHLRKTAPEESNVVFQLAKAYRLVGDEVKSAQLLAAVRDIAPKSVNKIKRLLETVKDESPSEDRMDTR
ncbi:TPR-like protein [Hymenopellis radicata]|nr:TPR-like protein [Hymenopellis radicata]